MKVLQARGQILCCYMILFQEEEIERRRIERGKELANKIHS